MHMLPREFIDTGGIPTEMGKTKGIDARIIRVSRDAPAQS